MAVNHQHCSTRNIVKKPQQRNGLHLSIFICVKKMWNETLDQTTTRKGCSSQNNIETRFHCVILIC